MYFNINNIDSYFEWFRDFGMRVTYFLSRTCLMYLIESQQQMYDINYDLELYI